MTAKPKTVPELRFPGFETSWQTGRVDSFLVLQRGFDLTKKNSGEGTFPVYSSSGISYYHDEYKVRSPGIVTGRKGSVGPVFLVNEDFWPHDTSLWVKDFKGNAVEFLYYFLIQFDLTRFDEASSVPTLNRNNVHREQSAIPTLPEQRKIADFLTAVDGRIGQLSQKKALLEDYKKGVMQQLFTQALRFKDDHGNDFPEWEEKNFTDVLGTTSPRGFQIQSSEILPEGRFKVVDQGKALIAGYCDDSEKVMRTCPVIVYGDHTTIIKYVDFEFVVGADGTQILVSKDQRNDLKYLYYNLAQNNVTQEGYKRHFSILKGILMQIPSPAEQTKIANFLTALDRKIESVAQQIRHTQAFKKGLLQQMFV
jgi:type I restriction enzyme, S subunit